ncbi:MAG: hypothetical protein DI555_07995 [Novosphingobium pentaromativorans]|uniref:LexA repressor DNA-binding domain-containing protein n=1 Tax=Novosphingobium pentaromativorans TaxID=205844 RepID=A0A2W5QUX3_9SPHN|nr:MAG: hypothetical protein DI555_07995 [Novosphingobium pentaromativorans]
MSNTARPALSDRATKLLELLTRCAAEGRAAPSNADLTAFLQLDRANTVPRIMQRLEERGLIVVERYSCSRIVTIVATGQRTAGVPGTPHWMDANRAARAEKKPKSDPAPVVRSPVIRSQPHAVSVDRDPCPRCGVRGDIGCRHSRAALRLASVPVFRHFSEVARG